MSDKTSGQPGRPRRAAPPAAQSESRPTAQPESRRLTDPLELRALAHPVRIRLLAAVGLRGTLTATEAVEFVGGSPASCAYHLRTLAKYGFIEDAGADNNRERPWRLTQAGFSWSEHAAEPEQRAVGRALGDVVHGEWLANIRRYRANADLYPVGIQEISGGSEIVLYATPAEVAGVQRQIQALLAPFKQRVTDPAARPAAHTPIEMIIFTHPATPPPATGS
ncbi:MAG TPA: helix-turn-helix domain-containing protein [Trebonia sp.]